MKYRNPKTGERRILGGSNVNAQARELETAGWVRVDGPPLTATPAPKRIAKRRKSPGRRITQAEAPESKPEIEPGQDA